MVLKRRVGTNSRAGKETGGPGQRQRAHRVLAKRLRAAHALIQTTPPLTDHKAAS